MSTQSPSSVLDELFPAVVQCFSVTFAGYLAGRLHLISSTQARGIEIYIGKFALPSLIFLSLTTLNFQLVEWNFFFAVLISKSIVFAVVLPMTWLLTRPSHLSIAALFAIFCTQSNDFAMGYPIISAIYDTTHPEFVNYLYLVAPVSLCLLNPIGFFCMELWKHRNMCVTSPGAETRINHQVSIGRIVVSSVHGVLTNPIVVMTVLGLLGNLILSGRPLPRVLFDILDTFGRSFSATALFVLGLRLVARSGAPASPLNRSSSSVSSSSYMVPLILITIKSVVMPLITRQTISVLEDLSDHSSSSASNFTVDITNYAFLYGILPTAPSVLVYATQYQLVVPVVANALLIGTFVSTPLMFVSAWVVSLYSTVAPANYIDSINVYLADIGLIGLACCVWVLVVFVLSGKVRRVPHFFTACLVISQSLACVGAILSTYIADSQTTTSFYLRFMPRVVGVFCSRVWTAMVAVALVLIQRRSLCFVLRCRPAFVAVGWAAPALLTVALLATNGGRHLYEGDPGFELGRYESVPAIIILTASLGVTVTCLVLHHRHEHTQDATAHPSGDQDERGVECDVEAEDDDGQDSPTVDDSLLSSGSEEHSQDRQQQQPQQDGNVTPQHSAVSQCRGASRSGAADRLTCSRSRPCYPGCGRQCRSVVRGYLEDEGLEISDAAAAMASGGGVGAVELDHLLQVQRHVTLLVLLVLSMIVGLFLSVWNLFMERMVGVYAVVDFIDGALNFGQGVFVFALFGLDDQVVVGPLVRWWRRLVWGRDTVPLPEPADVAADTRAICAQFVAYHVVQCRRELERDVRSCRVRQYRRVFTGVQLVDWLMRVGLAADRGEAVRYGRHLVDGRVLRHYRQQHHFADRPVFYQLVSGVGEGVSGGELRAHMTPANGEFAD